MGAYQMMGFGLHLGLGFVGSRPIGENGFVRSYCTRPCPHWQLNQITCPHQTNSKSVIDNPSHPSHPSHPCHPCHPRPAARPKISLSLHWPAGTVWQDARTPGRQDARTPGHQGVRMDANSSKRTSLSPIKVCSFAWHRCNSPYSPHVEGLNSKPCIKSAYRVLLTTTSPDLWFPVSMIRLYS